MMDRMDRKEEAVVEKYCEEFWLSLSDEEKRRYYEGDDMYKREIFNGFMRKLNVAKIFGGKDIGEVRGWW